MIGHTKTKSQKSLGTNLLGRDSYGYETSKHFQQLKDYNETEPRQLYHPQTGRDHYNNNYDPPPIGSGRRTGHTPMKGESEQQTERHKLIVDQKELNYRSQMQELIRQNEELKLKHRQAEIRANELENRASTNNQTTPNKRGLFASNASVESLEDEYNRANLVGRYQLSVRRMLDLYGCNREQSSIEHCKSERDIIEFLVRTMCEQHEYFKARDAEERAKLSHDQREVGKVRESLKMLTETIELFKNRQNKYKEKADEVRREWLATTSKLAKSENIREKLELELSRMEQSLHEHQRDIIRIQEESRADQQAKQQEIKALEQQVQQVCAESTRFKTLCQQLEMEVSEVKLQSEEWQLRLKVKDDELARSNRQTARWKERFEWLEQERAGTTGQFARSVAESRKRFSQQVQSEYKTKMLENIQERSSEILDEQSEDSVPYVQSISHPLFRSQKAPSEVTVYPNRHREPVRTEPLGHNNVMYGTDTAATEFKKSPAIRRIQTRGQQAIEPVPANGSASNLLENMLNKLEEHYADKLADSH